MWVMVNTPVDSLPVVELLGLEHHLILTHLLKSNKAYKRFYKRLSTKQKHWITLDNSVFETNEPMVDLDLARELQVSEVVAPDYFYDHKKTLEATSKFLGENNLEGIDVMGVPQGDNANNYYQCLEAMLDNPNISSIGLGKFATLKVIDFPEEMDKNIKALLGRLNVLSYIYREGLGNIKDFHMLGLINPSVEIPLFRNLSFLRSFDTSYPYRRFSGDETADFLTPTTPVINKLSIEWIIHVKEFLDGSRPEIF